MTNRLQIYRDTHITAAQGDELLFTTDTLTEAFAILKDVVGGGDVALWRGDKIIALRFDDRNILRIRRDETEGE